MALGEILSRPMISLFNDLKWKIDIITPVPLGIARLSQRGYNQAALLAKPLALGTNINYQPKALKKIRETVSQVGLSYRERRSNVIDAFNANKDTVQYKNILVVDDVTSSGATMEACSRALKNAGANEVYGITLAGSLHNDDYPMN
jgi:ComF family protein